MKAQLLVLLAILGMASGCSKKSSADVAPEAAATQLFEKGKGLRLPDELLRSLGVETIEVAEKEFHRELPITVKVYQSGQGSTPGRALGLLENDAAKSLTPGQAATLLGNAGDTNVIVGRLVHLDWHALALGQVEALIEFHDPEGQWGVGSSISAVFTTAEAARGFAVPASAILESADASFAYTVSGSHFVHTPVKLGARKNDWVEIKDGLYAGDAVVTRGGERMWMIELCALKGGTPCCPATKRHGRADD